MKILVTGGHGFIGSVVVRKLLARGDAVRCLVRKTSRTHRIDGVPVERFEGDLLDPDSLARAAAGCAAVIHLACLSSWDSIDTPEITAVAVRGTQNVLSAAMQAGCVRAVYVSSALAVGATRRPVPMNEDSVSEVPIDGLRYPAAKRMAEAACLEAVSNGFPVVIVNPAEVYGPNDDGMVTAGNLVDFAKSWPVLVSDGGLGLAHVEDVADGIVAALDRGRSGERYILSGENLSVRGLAELTLDLAGLRRPILAFPNVLVRWLAWMGTHLRLPLPFAPAIAPYVTLYWFMDSGKARRELGVSFRSARETLASTLAWLKQTGRLN